MTVQSRATLKSYFPTGATITNSSLVDLIDSFVAIADTTAQSLSSDINAITLIAAQVSAGSGSFSGTVSANDVSVSGNVSANNIFANVGAFSGNVSANTIYASSATFARRAQVGVGIMPVYLEATVAASTTSQIGTLPSCDIFDLYVKVLVASSAAAGGTQVNIGTATDSAKITQVTVSAVGFYRVDSRNGTAVSARAMVAFSGAIFAVAPNSTATGNFVVGVGYLPR